MPDETLTTAPVDAGQPVPQAVETSAVQEGVPSDTPAVPASDAVTAAPVAPDKLWAGKFKAPEILEESYTHLQSEASRMAAELATLRRQALPVAPVAAAAPTYTADQLETMKEQWLVKASTEPDQAVQAAHQIRLIDAELRKGEFTQHTARQTSQEAYRKLTAEVQPILTQYKDDLVPGSPVYNQAQALYQDAITAGAPENDVTATSAVLLALAKSGKFSQNATLKAGQTATHAINQALKTAAVAGGGSSNTGRSATPDIASMSKQEFADFRKSMGFMRT
jgi:hypothetical protein